MVDPNALIGGGLAVLASKDLLTKLLGPTAEYIGGEIKGLVEKCNFNINDIFVRAYRKLGSCAEQPGTVNPRVLKIVLDDGKFCEDGIAKEYLAGVLASSRTEDGKDDRGVTNAKLVSTLSSYQIRTHYTFYTLLRRAFLPYSSIVFPGVHRAAMVIYISSKTYYSAMRPLLKPSKDTEINFLTHSINGLKRSDLIEDRYTIGSQQDFVGQKLTIGSQEFEVNEKVLSEYGICFRPTPSGMELYLWAHGFGDRNHFQFLDGVLNFPIIDEVQLPSKADLLFKDLQDYFEATARKG